MTESSDPSRRGDSKFELEAAERHRRALESNAWLIAIVENSDDAILSKTLDGVITSWNGGAERLFGFTAQEAIGQPITMIIPEDRLAEETAILSRISAGQRVDHFETIRQAKDGTLIDVSATISPVRDTGGAIIGASKILRDIGESKRAAERQALLLREMHHRIKNLFALTAGLVALSARASGSVEELASTLDSRIASLARAHALTLPDLSGDFEIDDKSSTTLCALLNAILEPHDGHARVVMPDSDVTIGGHALTSLALLLHELATNAAKYGALSSENGQLVVEFRSASDMLKLIWTETGIAPPTRKIGEEGFGTKLEQASLRGLNGTLEREWKANGLVATLTIPISRLAS